MINEVGFLPIYVYDKPNVTFSEIRDMVVKEVKDGIVFIDYLQLLSYDDYDGYHNPDSLITNKIILKELKDLAKDAGVPIVVLSDLWKGFEESKNKRPDLEDFGISYNAVIKNADTVTLIYRDDYCVHQNGADIAELLIWKKTVIRKLPR